MKKDRWLFLLKLAVFSIGLGLLWFYFLQAQYPKLIQPVFIPLFEVLDIRKWRLYQLLDHFTNLVTYTVLILSTPGIIKNWKKSLICLFGGLLILVVGHFFLSWIDYYYYAQYKQSRTFFRSAFHFYILNDTLPLILWLLFYPGVLTKLFPFMKFWERKTVEEEIEEK